MRFRKCVFLVEDDKDDQDLFIKTVNALDHVTLYGIANNGKEALEKLSKSDDLPSLIFMDINMPLMNGMECLEEIRKNPKMKSIPVIILSTSALQREQAGRLGAKGYIKKGGNDHLLRSQLEQVLSFDFFKDSGMQLSI